MKAIEDLFDREGMISDVRADYLISPGSEFGPLPRNAVVRIEPRLQDFFYFGVPAHGALRQSRMALFVAG